MDIIGLHPPADGMPYALKGDTGSGKSSILNAVLGEVCILPTNGMRACTAAIIEMAAHDVLLEDEGQPEGLPSSSSGATTRKPRAPYLGFIEFLSG